MHKVCQLLSTASPLCVLPQCLVVCNSFLLACVSYVLLSRFGRVCARCWLKVFEAKRSARRIIRSPLPGAPDTSRFGGFPQERGEVVEGERGPWGLGSFDRSKDGELGTIRSFLQSTENCEVSTLKELEAGFGNASAGWGSWFCVLPLSPCFRCSQGGVAPCGLLK